MALEGVGRLVLIAGGLQERTGGVNVAAEKAGIEAGDFSSGGKNSDRGRSRVERCWTKRERINGDGALQLRPGRRRRGVEAVNEVGEQRALYFCTEQGGLKGGCVEIGEVQLEFGRAGLRRNLLGATSGSG